LVPLPDKELAVCETTTFRSCLDFSGEQDKKAEGLFYPPLDGVTLKPVFLYVNEKE